MKKGILAILMIFGLCQMVVAGSKEDIFIEAQKISADFEQQEAALMKKYDPYTAEFYALWIPLQGSRRQLNLIAFRWLQSNDPNSIDWNNVWNWTNPLESSEAEQRMIGNSVDFKNAYTEYQSKKTALFKRKDLFDIRNRTYEQHLDNFRELETKRLHRLNELQKRLSAE